MKEWQKVLLGVAVFVVLAFVADRGFGCLSEKFYYSSKYGIFRRNIYCLTESKDEVLIFGSSRAAHHYVPQVFEDSLGLSCYNCGSDGECIYYHYAILSSYIERGDLPKMVVLDVNSSDVCVSHTGTFDLDCALDRLAPHYGQYASIDSLFALNGWKETLKMNLMTYRYNSKLVQAIKCNFIPWPEDRGYEALIGSSLDSTDVFKISDEMDAAEYEENKIVYLRKFISACKDNGIPMVIAHSPSFGYTPSEGLDYIRSVALEYGVPYLDYGKDERFMSPRLFKDGSHLNDEGAKSYSVAVVAEIKKLLLHLQYQKGLIHTAASNDFSIREGSVHGQWVWIALFAYGRYV